MYLTDYRERTLKDVITQLEPGLFKKVTGLDVKDFEMLCTLGVFNASLMNDAIFKFKRYEDASLSYTGIDLHAAADVGGWDTVIKREEYERLFYNQQSTMSYVAPKPAPIQSAPKKPEPKPTEEKPKPVAQPSYTTPTRKPITTQFGEPRSPYSPGVRPTVVVPEKPKIEFDASKVYEGAKVKHKTFGEGTVTKMDKAEKHIRVRFAVGEKTFIYPDAFHNGYLSV